MTAIPLASLFTLSSDILICFGVGLLIAVSLGFVAGYLLGKGSTDRDFRRAKKTSPELLPARTKVFGNRLRSLCPA